MRPSRLRALRIFRALNRLCIKTTITAAELCTIGIWERLHVATVCWAGKPSKYVWDRVRQIRGEDAQASLGTRTRGQVRAHMTMPIVVTPTCAACGTLIRHRARRPRILACTVGAEPSIVQSSILQRRESGQWYLRGKGVVTSNGDLHLVGQNQLSSNSRVVTCSSSGIIIGGS